MEVYMWGLILLVMGICFVSISFLVFLACMLLGSGKDVSMEYEESMKLKRFMRKYQNHVDGVKDESSFA